MAFSLPMSDTRRLPLYRSQFVSRVADNTRIGAARINGNQLGYKTTCCTSSLKADIYPELKPDIFVYYHLKSRPDDFIGNLDAYSLEEDGTLTKHNIHDPPSFLLENFFFQNSCNGLFYLSRTKKRAHALWNPTMREYKILPEPYAEPPPCLKYFDEGYGMWCNHSLEDCKVVNLVHALLEEEKNCAIESTHHIDLYSLKTISWKRIPCNAPYSFDATRIACISGIFYFTRTKVILCFSFSTETFSKLPLPDGWLPSHSHILEYKGLLSALVYSEDGKYYRFWVMRYGLWRRRDIVFHIPCMQKPLCFSQDGKLLYFVSLDEELMVFDCATGKLKHLDVNSDMWIPEIFPFVENFVQLNGISCVEEAKFLLILINSFSIPYAYPLFTLFEVVSNYMILLGSGSGETRK